MIYPAPGGQVNTSEFYFISGPSFAAAFDHVLGTGAAVLTHETGGKPVQVDQLPAGKYRMEFTVTGLTAKDAIYADLTVR